MDEENLALLSMSPERSLVVTFPPREREADGGEPCPHRAFHLGSPREVDLSVR